MHITKIELEDIKSHAHFVQEFQRGTIAITGENGAGKTTLIEAVAWTLFDLLDYKKDDFVRRGKKKVLSALHLKAVWTSANILFTAIRERVITFTIRN